MNVLHKALLGAAALTLGLAAPALAAPGGVSLGHATAHIQSPANCVEPGPNYGNKVNITNHCDTPQRVQALFTDGWRYHLGTCYTLKVGATQTFVGPIGYHFLSWQHC
ncbi:hypothetical protein [Kutzneria sp. NPDC052558]|uniref:hypothetical protein n=1 Tax=Kutzneria sp. NPDC052558 TaxID=3364121 RepID=UPI0037C6A44E